MKKTLHDKGMSTAVGDEGGFAPNLESNEAALGVLVEAIRASGYVPGDQVAIALDPAVSGLFKDGSYVLEHEGRTLTAEQLADYWGELVDQYPIISLEDGMGEEDWLGWALLTERLGSRLQLVGDDIFVTNTERLQRGIDAGVANSILIKVNQIGTLTETLAAMRIARENGYTCRDVAPVGGDRGRDDRGPGRRHRLRTDQDRRAVADRSGRQVQPVAADRGGARRRRPLSGAQRVPVVVGAGWGEFAGVRWRRAWRGLTVAR